MGRQQKGRRLAGFTLVELLAVVAVVSIIYTLASPALSEVVGSARLRTGASTFHENLMLARSEAIKRGVRVVLCKSSSGDVCTRNGGWEQGWIVFHDANNNAARDPGESLLSREPALTGRIRVAGNGPVADYVSYTPEGVARLTSGAFQAGTVTACSLSSGPVQARQIVIAISGRPRIAKTTVQSCG